MTKKTIEKEPTNFKVVANREEQYSIWPDNKELPPGWEEETRSGSKADCLAYIKHVWTDMRPLSLRKKMMGATASSTQKNPEPEDKKRDRKGDTEESLAVRLSKGDHKIMIGHDKRHSVKNFKESIDRGYVYITFTETKGKTEIGIPLDMDTCNWNNSNFENGTGCAHLEGELTLDSVPVRCVADVELKTLEGTGHLDLVENS